MENLDYENVWFDSEDEAIQYMKDYGIEIDHDSRKDVPGASLYSIILNSEAIGEYSVCSVDNNINNQYYEFRYYHCW